MMFKGCDGLACDPERFMVDDNRPAGDGYDARSWQRY